MPLVHKTINTHAIVLRRRPVTAPTVQDVASRRVGPSLLRFGNLMIYHQRQWLAGSAFIGLISLVYVLMAKSLPVGIIASLSGVMFTVACFNAWREEYHKRLDAEERAALLTLENEMLRRPPAMLEMRGAELRVQSLNQSYPQVSEWSLLIRTYVTPTPGELITFPLHKCEIVVKPVVNNYIAEALLTADSAGFLLMMSVSDPVITDASEITVSRPTQVLFSGTVRLVGDQVAHDEIPSLLSATLRVRDSQGGWFEDVETLLERVLVDGELLWHAWPDEPKEYPFLDGVSSGTRNIESIIS